MAFDYAKRRRQSYRLRNFDYAQPGAYFITICAWQRHCWFGDIDEKALSHIRAYIQNNPKNWMADQLHPQNPSKW